MPGTVWDNFYTNSLNFADGFGSIDVNSSWFNSRVQRLEEVHLCPYQEEGELPLKPRQRFELPVSFRGRKKGKTWASHIVLVRHLYRNRPLYRSSFFSSPHKEKEKREFKK